MKDIQVNVSDVQARYVKVYLKNIGTCPEWHKGAGGQAWLFVDDVDIE